MVEEIKTQSEWKNTVGTVGMWFSIIWLIAFISVILIWLWIPLLLVWFILWIIGLFYRPRKKARVAVCIPVILLVILAWVGCYIWSSVKAPAHEFIEWVEPQLEQFENDENFDGDRFGDILQIELNNVSEDEWKSLFESSTGSNFLEKGAHTISSMLKNWFESALEKYNNGEIPELDEEENNIIDVNVEVNEEDDEKEENDIEEEITIESGDKENNEALSQSEKNDIDQIIDILE